jgi:hypothetical protein
MPVQSWISTGSSSRPSRISSDQHHVAGIEHLQLRPDAQLLHRRAIARSTPGVFTIT